MSEMYLTTADMAVEEEELILSMRQFGELQNCGERGDRIFENIQMGNAMQSVYVHINWMSQC